MFIIRRELSINVDERASDVIQVSLTLGGDAATTLGILLEDLELFEGLEGLSVDGSRGINVVGGAAAVVLAASVDDLEGAYTDSRSEVNVTGNRGNAGVKPVRVIRGELLAGSGFNEVDPGGDLEFSSSFQMSGVCFDKLVGINVTDCGSNHFGYLFVDRKI
jgi:hypothetical protein